MFDKMVFSVLNKLLFITHTWISPFLSWTKGDTFSKKAKEGNIAFISE